MSTIDCPWDTSWWTCYGDIYIYYILHKLYMSFYIWLFDVNIKLFLQKVGVFHNGWMWIKNRLTSHGRKGSRLRKNMKNAETFDEWKLAAEELDRVSTNLLSID